jgi:hypothetical protein
VQNRGLHVIAQRAAPGAPANGAAAGPDEAGAGD